jgi:predicted membrane protein (TIGR00267 family)
MFKRLRHFVSISRSHRIARRYFVVNGFDGALTMLGLLMGFYFSSGVKLSVAITACLGAAIALGMSGFSSAYLSEAAERKREFHKLQTAMVSDLNGSAHEEASRWVPLLIALVNGISPLIISLLIISPLWLEQAGVILPVEALEAAIGVAFLLIFFLGVFLGTVSGVFWLYAGLQALVIALLTSLLIYVVS